jgi:hypothetical protein
VREEAGGDPSPHPAQERRSANSDGCRKPHRRRREHLQLPDARRGRSSAGSAVTYRAHSRCGGSRTWAGSALFLPTPEKVFTSFIGVGRWAEAAASISVEMSVFAAFVLAVVTAVPVGSRWASRA